jgi:hypothetical protein
LFSINFLQVIYLCFIHREAVFFLHESLILLKSNDLKNGVMKDPGSKFNSLSIAQ